MHGLINRALQRFTLDTYGAAAWQSATREAGLGFSEFEAMLDYEPDLTAAIVGALCRVLDKPRDAVLEDLGTYLVTHPNSAGIRRLLRFSGEGFTDFLNSLDELPGRARLAVPGLDLPRLTLRRTAPDRYRLECDRTIPGFGHVLVGVLRAMADDYGALVTLAHTEDGGGVEVVEVALILAGFAEGRDFDLGARMG